MRRALVVLAVVVVLLVAGGAVYLGPIGPIATGYAAQIGCGVHHLAGRPMEDVVPELPDNPLVPFLRVSAPDDRTVEATLLGLYGSTSVVTEDGGCRLVGDAAELGTDGEDSTPAPTPPPLGDDLAVPTDLDGAATAHGFDAAALTAVLDAAFAEDDDPDTEVGTRAVVVVHDGEVVAERYADGFDAETRLHGWSMTKTVANVAAGSLVLDGLLDLEDGDLWGGWPADDPRRAITVRDALTMTDGLAFEEVYDPDTDATQMLFVPRDIAAFVGGMPQVADPGTRWSYSSGTTNLLCERLAVADGGDPATLLDRRVFTPLGMTSAVVGTDAAGTPVCSSFGYATARDWARLGLLFLQDGVWAGERVVPEGWVDFSRRALDLPSHPPYGAHVWLNADIIGTVEMRDVPTDAYWASGHEGQKVVVLPSDDLVVVRLGLTRGFGESEDWGLERLLAGVLTAREDG